MARTVLIDAYNLMHAVPELGFARGRFPATRRLIRRLAGWAEHRRERVVLVFDGAPPPELPPAGRLELRFARELADADLMELLERPGVHTLVSADRELVDRAHSLGQSALPPRAFWAGLSEEEEVRAELAERSPSLADDEIDYWLEEFGDHEALAKRRAERDRHKGGLPPRRSAKEREGRLSADEVADWMRYFGEG